MVHRLDKLGDTHDPVEIDVIQLRDPGVAAGFHLQANRHVDRVDRLPRKPERFRAVDAAGTDALQNEASASHELIRRISR